MGILRFLAFFLFGLGVIGAGVIWITQNEPLGVSPPQDQAHEGSSRRHAKDNLVLDMARYLEEDGHRIVPGIPKKTLPPLPPWEEHSDTRGLKAFEAELEAQLRDPSEQGQSLRRLLVLNSLGEIREQNDALFIEKSLQELDAAPEESLVAIKTAIQNLPPQYARERNLLVQMAGRIKRTESSTAVVKSLFHDELFTEDVISVDADGFRTTAKLESLEGYLLIADPEKKREVLRSIASTPAAPQLQALSPELFREPQAFPSEPSPPPSP